MSPANLSIADAFCLCSVQHLPKVRACFRVQIPHQPALSPSIHARMSVPCNKAGDTATRAL